MTICQIISVQRLEYNAIFGPKFNLIQVSSNLFRMTVFQVYTLYSHTHTHTHSRSLAAHLLISAYTLVIEQNIYNLIFKNKENLTEGKKMIIFHIKFDTVRFTPGGGKGRRLVLSVNCFPVFRHPACSLPFR